MSGEKVLLPTPEYIERLERRVAALEAAHPEDLKDVAQDVTNIFVKLSEQYERIVALEEAIRAFRPLPDQPKQPY
jgi:hypothetical protein